MSRIARAVVVLWLVPSVGCGVVFGGTRQTVRTTSSPEGATVATAPATVSYRTPTALALERKNSYVLTFSMDGYSSQQVQIDREMRTGVLIADILLTGLIGVIVDATTGGWYRLSPDVASVTLTRTDADADGPETITVSIDSRTSDGGEALELRSTIPGVEVGLTAGSRR